MAIKYHQPKKLPTNKLFVDFNKLENLTKANYALGVLQGSQKKLQNPNLLISPLTAKEAVASSKIEGTQSTISDIFLYEARGDSKYKDTLEVVNYRNAMNSAIFKMKKDQKLSLGTIRALHQILLSGVRHQGIPGKLREGDVWIGKKQGDSIENAIYVPPRVYSLDEYLSNLFEYIEKSNDDSLVKAGIAHYQFEAIHPFDDGNGRIGRLLIPLILFKEKKISSPILYMSGYFEKNRNEYVNALRKVDKGGDYEEWLDFFFESVAIQLQETQETIERIYNLFDIIKEKFHGSKSPYVFPFLEFIFKSPLFSIKQAKKNLRCSSRITIRSIITEFQNKGIIKEFPKNKREKIFVFIPLLKILD